MPVYALTVLLSASLLFLVQPLIAKIILPWFGGTSAVWSTTLVFFQMCLLAGYLYAHWLATYMEARKQAYVHVALLLIACALMPIVPSDAWRPADANDPTFRILLLLTVTVGLPCLLLSSTSPLLQAWYVRNYRSQVPFWLFALSNAGSLLALLSFPLLLEPNVSSTTLAGAWSIAFGMFALACAWLAWRSRTLEPLPSQDTPDVARAPSAGQMALWIAFAACASGLLVSISAHLTTNVAPIPLLWVLPLAVYLLTFILNFSQRRFYHRTYFFPLLALAIGTIAYLYVHSYRNFHVQYLIPIYLACLFVVCMACHGELVVERPAARYLTRFYLLIALGGALGGLFVAIVAPLAFATHLELPLLLIALAELSVLLQWHRRGSRRTLWLVRIAMVAGVLVLATSLIETELETREQHLLVRRNFYGVLRVQDYLPESELARRDLLHGTITHGYQYANAAYRDFAGSYYSRNSGIGRILDALEAKGPVRVGVIGLGVGVLASYARGGDHFGIYEINPAVVEIANMQFTFLSRARERGADLAIHIGDARLLLERQASQHFDVLIVDAFSSDAIPTHLLTNEAVAVYLKHLQPDGILAIHVSNRYLDLEPVTRRAADHVARFAISLYNSADAMSNASTWVMIASDRAVLSDTHFGGAMMQLVEAAPSFRGWTDQYSSIWPILKMHEGVRGAVENIVVTGTRLSRDE